jgi:hypothetical protein
MQSVRFIRRNASLRISIPSLPFEILFQLCPAQRFLPAPFCNEFPELFATAQLHLLFIHSFDAHDKRNRFSVTRQHDDPR